MKKIHVLCEIGGEVIPYPVYVGRPTPGLHPFHYQAAWLREKLGARILSLEGKEEGAFEGDGDTSSGAI